MGLDDLAKKLSDTARIGLNAELVQKLGIRSADATRGRLMADLEGDHGHLGVYLLGCYVVDDTDFWGDGEVYWWSIPALLDAAGNVQPDSLYGLPNGAPPHKVGSQEWMTNLTLAETPLLAVIPPRDDLQALVLRVAFYDDDGAAANLPEAISAGLEAYAGLAKAPMKGAEQIITPVREAIWKSLRAEQDDILIDQDVIVRRGETGRFGAGMIGSVINAMCRLYYIVLDESTTERFGPINLHKGQMETVQFKSKLKGGGRLAIFARGSSVTCATFGDLETDKAFINKIIDGKHEATLAEGFGVIGTGPSKLVAYYTPP